MISTLNVARAGSLWYPIMLAQEHGEITEARGAELLGMDILHYREKKQEAIQAVKTLVEQLPSPLSSLVDILREQPEFFAKSPCQSSSSSMHRDDESRSADQRS